MGPQTLSYSTEIEWRGKRRGKLQSAGLSDLWVSTPPEFKGEEGYWTPEHLLIASAESCLMATFLGIAENSHLAVAKYRSTAQGRMEFSEGSGWRFVEIAIYPVVELENSDGYERARRVMAKAEKGCLIAKSLSATLRVEPAFVSNNVEVIAA